MVSLFPIGYVTVTGTFGDLLRLDNRRRDRSHIVSATAKAITKQSIDSPLVYSQVGSQVRVKSLFNYQVSDARRRATSVLDNKKNP